MWLSIRQGSHKGVVNNCVMGLKMATVSKMNDKQRQTHARQDETSPVCVSN